MVKVKKMYILLTQQTLAIMHVLVLKLMQHVKLKGLLLG